ncbi:hypothetical protein HN51_040903 [Arachis hypogaea]|uniref:VQ domain-containing protein n=1 Tax=Arachis hypogaea TaxID=3818 RepID=A0A444YQE3_ARAHY|nr:calmodulin-binding protein 25 [Arachis ipaensis]XP_025658138.1 calmodulin-binding protein 25 [Arachis hypogaea]QHN86556.1 Calmodulin-binding protein [Arachis hypogaea]RYR04098.1 hypothetical protein Ahy_B06g083673 [Arachis hypogaea]
MASSENLIESWAFRPALDTWFADYIARDAETLTKALQKSISGDDVLSPFIASPKPDATTAAASTPTVSGISAGSDQESAPKRRGSTLPPATGRVTKRKSRASKRSQTTFITADPANFRQMVQQVTGVRFGGGAAADIAMAPVLKPEPQRLVSGGGGRFPAGAACLLPTLDTSAFLLDHHQQQVVGPNSGSAGPGVSVSGPLPFSQPMGLVDASPSLGSADFDTFSSFPTLESWKVM